MNKCSREGCNQEAAWSLFMPYCSSECDNLSLRLAAEWMDAIGSGEDPPEMQDLLDRRERAKRWTPETMQKYIDTVTA